MTTKEMQNIKDNHKGAAAIRETCKKYTPEGLEMLLESVIDKRMAYL